MVVVLAVRGVVSKEDPQIEKHSCILIAVLNLNNLYTLCQLFQYLLDFDTR